MSEARIPSLGGRSRRTYRNGPPLRGDPTVVAFRSRGLVWWACLLIGVPLSGCMADVGAPSASYTVPLTDLTAEVHHEGEHLSQPGRLRVLGDALVVTDLQGHHNVHAIDRSTGQHRASFGAPGGAASEFSSPTSVPVDADGQPWVIDQANQRGTRIDLERVGEPTGWAAELLDLEPIGLFDATWTHAGDLLVDGLFPGARFGLIRPDGHRELVGELPAEVSANAYARLLHRVILASRPDLERHVAAGWWYPRLEILDSTGEVVERADTPIATEPTYEVTEAGAVISPDSPNGYVSAAVDSERIYALYAGRTTAEHGPIQSYGRDVHVFDWDGRFIEVFRLDRDAFAIEIDPEHGHLLTIGHNPSPAIWRYALPQRATEGASSTER